MVAPDVNEGTPNMGFWEGGTARIGLLERVSVENSSGSGTTGVLSREDVAEGVDDSWRRWLFESTSLTDGGYWTLRSKADESRAYRCMRE